MTIRAPWTSYLVLSGLWVLIAIGYTLLHLQSQGRNLEVGALIAGGVAIFWGTWLRGFKIVLHDAYIEYRNGFFRTSRVALSEIADIKSGRTEWHVLGQRVGIPCLVVITKNGRIAMMINPKPFGRIGLQGILKELVKQDDAGAARRTIYKRNKRNAGGIP